MAKTKKYILKSVSWLLVAAWMVCIFCFSAQPAVKSSNTSMSVTRQIVPKFYPHFNKLPEHKQLNIIQQADHWVRKSAHAFFFLILGGLSILALGAQGIKNLKKILLALAINILYASSDEIHQIFVPGRGPMVTDVLIDTAGAFIGIIIFMALMHFYMYMKKLIPKHRKMK